MDYTMSTKIALIKRVREQYGFGLKEAKDLVEKYDCQEYYIDMMARKMSRDGLTEVPQENPQVAYKVSEPTVNAAFSPFNLFG